MQQKKEEAKHREQIIKERMKIEGKLELQMAGLEFNQDRWAKVRDE